MGDFHLLSHLQLLFCWHKQIKDNNNNFSSNKTPHNSMDLHNNSMELHNNTINYLLHKLQSYKSNMIIITKTVETKETNNCPLSK